jgi:hypothetical protein
MAARKTVKIEPAEPQHICKECRHVHLKRAEGLFCRRYPPTPVYEYQSGAISSNWPEVDPQFWCGEFAPQLSS